MGVWNFRRAGPAAAWVLLLASGRVGVAQEPAAKGALQDRPLPEIAALMHAVETNQHAAEAVAKRYVYRSVQTMRHTDKHAAVKEVESAEYDVYWMGNVQVRRLLRKNGRELSPSEQKKEDERVAKEAAKAKERRDRMAAEGKATNGEGNEEVTVSRLLELGRFTNACRVELDERPTIKVDFAGNPAAKTRNKFEEVIRDMEGTVWVDEHDKAVRRVEGRFVHDFKVGGGLLVDIRQGTRFEFDQRRVNDEVWLPARAEAVGAMRALLLFHFDGSASFVDSDYRRYQATSTILPGVGKVEEPAGDGAEVKP